MPRRKRQTVETRRKRLKFYRQYKLHRHEVMNLENQISIDPITATAMTIETEAETELDVPLTSAIKIVHRNSEELILPNCLSSPKDDIEPEVDPLAPDSEEITPGPVKILTSSSDETEEQEESKRAKRVKVETPKSRFKCEICIQSYLREADLVKHIRHRSRDAPIKCTKCLEEFCNVFDWTTHNNSAHRTKSFKCSHPGCFKSFRVVHQFKAHQKVHEASHNPVEFPGRNSRAKKMNDAKNSRGNQGQKYPCQNEKGKRETKFKKKLPAQEVATSPDPCSRPGSEPRFKCDMCVLSDLSQSSLVNHIRNRSKNAPIKCVQCPEQFCTVNDWNIHYKSTHGTNPFKCTYPGCFASFRAIRDLNAHISWVHDPEKTFQCSVESCGKIFNRAHDLKIHQEMHDTNNGNINRNQKYPCPEPGCSMSFNLEFSLNAHMARKHSNIQEGVPEPNASALVKVEMQEILDLEPKIKLEAEGDSEWETLCEISVDQVQVEREENGVLVENAVVKVEEINVVPDLDFILS